MPQAATEAKPTSTMPVATTVAPTYVGVGACAGCHAEETRRWTGSHHDLAMQEANEHTVLGDFDDATFTYENVTSRFSRRDGRYVVRTDGPDGALHEYEIAYAFGVEPLQQYLVAMPGGRYQALGVAWDTRPAAGGGQRWFHLYPKERVGHDDVLHWTRPSQNWNDRCARCHSTGLRKNYREAADRYETTWAEIDVGCEACHGPGSAHVAWANGTGARDEAQKGLVTSLDEPATWVPDPATGIGRRSPPRTSHAELETCAPCHSRRAELGDDAGVGRPLLDGYLPALLTEGLYFADGQIQDEVYEWGSFLQSRMFHAGVTCSDCHDPHDLSLRAEGSAVCAQCHLPARFDTPEHHFHPTGSPGARCVPCHMPTRTYMVVDDRHDHGFRVPRPDLSAALGTPDACTACHRDRTPAWAAEAIARRPGLHRAGEPQWGEALAAGRRGSADADSALVRVAADAQQPDIVRATAVGLLAGQPGAAALATIRGAAAADAPPLLRLAAVEAVDGRDPRLVVAVAEPRLDDPLRAVRLTAGEALAGEPAALLSPERRATLDRVLDEYRAAQLANADRPESHLNLGILALQLGRPPDAEASFRTAMQRWPYFVPAYVNLADLRRQQARDAEGEAILRDALRVVPESAEAQHALGLVLVRRGQTAAALTALERATELAPDDARYAYVLGVALNSAGQRERARAVLRAAHERRPGDVDIVLALATISRDAGATDEARRWAGKLVELTPGDDGARRFRDELGGDQALEPPRPAR